MNQFWFTIIGRKTNSLSNIIYMPSDLNGMFYLIFIVYSICTTDEEIEIQAVLITAQEHMVFTFLNKSD